MTNYNDTQLRCMTLCSIPERKLTDALQKVIDDCEEDAGKKVSGGGLCDRCRIQSIALNRFYESNLPAGYWDLTMDNFKGFPGLRKKYEELTNDIQKTYSEGASVCFLGSHGVGKSMISIEILKKAVLTGYSCLYVNLTDIISLVANGSSSEKLLGRKNLMQTDFLVIDEVDSRHFSDGASSFFARTLEDVFRVRLQNLLPTFMCTNSNRMLDAFPPDLKRSLESLTKKITMFPVLGSDFRGVK